MQLCVKTVTGKIIMSQEKDIIMYIDKISSMEQLLLKLGKLFHIHKNKMVT